MTQIYLRFLLLWVLLEWFSKHLQVVVKSLVLRVLISIMFKKMFDKGTNKVVSYDPVVRLETSKTGVGVTSISDKELLPPPIRIKDDITSDTFKDFKL